MATKDNQYYIKRLQHYNEQLLFLRNAIDVLIEAMNKELPPPDGAPVRKRRNLMAHRVQEMTADLIKGTWRKPAELKKGSKRKGSEKK